MIVIKNLYKSFKDQVVLNDINATLKKGEINLIIGYSGSGKTTLLKCLLGLIEPTSGDIIYDDNSFGDINKRHISDLRKNAGMVFQGNALFDHMTVEENIMFPLEMITKQSKKEMQKRVDEVLKDVGLQGQNLKKPLEISGGMKKRVAIGRAIVTKPKYLFCDEPNSGLDPQLSKSIDQLLYDITQTYNMTTVINTHDMNSVINIGDNIFYLKNGCMVWKGNKKTIITTTQKDIIDFVFSNDLLKEIKERLG